MYAGRPGAVADDASPRTPHIAGRDSPSGNAASSGDAARSVSAVSETIRHVLVGDRHAQCESHSGRPDVAGTVIVKR